MLGVKVRISETSVNAELKRESVLKSPKRRLSVT